MSESYWEEPGTDPEEPWLNGYTHVVKLHDGKGIVTVCGLLTADIFATPEHGLMLMRPVEGPTTCVFCLNGERSPRAEEDEDEDDTGSGE